MHAQLNISSKLLETIDLLAKLKQTSRGMIVETFLNQIEMSKKIDEVILERKEALNKEIVEEE